ncbi:hypothetical protein VNO77_04085 [Canavalia gladiata]|uniref:Uncharacterized protein n=1 Tax=Canavalia gladiata TaxID=3824 RepID=A0AAN9N2E5_CANGL
MRMRGRCAIVKIKRRQGELRELGGSHRCVFWGSGTAGGRDSLMVERPPLPLTVTTREGEAKRWKSFFELYVWKMNLVAGEDGITVVTDVGVMIFRVVLVRLGALH